MKTLKRGRTFSERLYAALLFCYPAGFRRAYGREMALVFADRRREAARLTGPRPLVLLRLWEEALFDLARSAPVEWADSFMKGEGPMRTIRTILLAVTAYAFTLLVIAPLYARNISSLPSLVNSLLDALIATGLLFNFVYLVLTLPRWLEGVRAVRATLAITTAIVGLLITLIMLSGGPPARVNLMIMLSQLFALLAWFTVYMWWVLRKRTARPPATA